MKRIRTIESFFQSTSNQPPANNTNTDVSPSESAGAGASNAKESEPHVELNPDDINPDPGLRIPIEELHADVRDAARREYLAMGPCQPKGHVYEQERFGKQMRGFREEWYKSRDWLEYSVAKKATFCFHCFLFKQPRAENYGIEAFSKKGFSNWKKATTSFDTHVGNVNSAHNRARRHCQAFQNPRQNVEQVWAGSDKKKEEEYLGRLTIMLGVVRFLLLQALAFRGHDESTNSNNKGNFLEMVQWYKTKDPTAAKLLDCAPGNNLLTSTEIQKHLCKACGEETTKAIVQDIGDKKFAVLVDEARDASIKEQMAVALRFVCRELIFLMHLCYEICPY
jgi:hypothetical protein